MITQWLKRFYADWKHANYLKLRGGVDPCEAIRSDYAALLASHNALKEAVAWHLECDACPLKNTTEAEKHGFAAIWATRRAARAEVNRLLQEGQ